MHAQRTGPSLLDWRHTRMSHTQGVSEQAGFDVVQARRVFCGNRVVWADVIGVNECTILAEWGEGM